MLVICLLLPSIVSRIPAPRDVDQEQGQQAAQDRPARSGRPSILCLLTPFEYRARGWLLAAEGGLLQDERLKVRSAWNGEKLEVEYDGSVRGIWGNELRLTFDLADPARPAVEAEFSWFSDVGPTNATLRELTGEVFVVPLDDKEDPWARVRKGWNGRTPVQIGFELHGRHEAKPMCVHGVFELDPGAEEKEE